MSRDENEAAPVPAQNEARGRRAGETWIPCAAVRSDALVVCPAPYDAPGLWFMVEAGGEISCFVRLEPAGLLQLRRLIDAELRARGVHQLHEGS